MPNFAEFMALLSAVSGIVYGFGYQSHRINTLNRNMNDLANLHRETIAALQALRIEIAVIHKDIEYLKNK